MLLLNNLVCASRQGHTALPDSCAHNPDLITGLLAVPKGTVWTATQLAAIQTTIQAGLVNDTYSSCYHYFGAFEGIDDQSEERQQQTFAYGRKTTTRDEKYYWTFPYLDGYMCKHKAYMQFKGREDEFDFFILDKSRNIIGTEAYDTYGFLTGMKGVTLDEFYENNWKPKDGSNETMHSLSIGLKDSKELNERYAYITVNFNISDLNMIKDIVLTPLTTLDAGAVTVAVQAGCGGTNMLYANSDLIDASLYSVKNTVTGATIDITGVSSTGIGNNMALVFDIDETDTDYPASNAYATITMAAPSVIFAAAGDYYRANSFDIIEQA